MSTTVTEGSPDHLWMFGNLCVTGIYYYSSLVSVRVGRCVSERGKTLGTCQCVAGFVSNLSTPVGGDYFVCGGVLCPPVYVCVGLRMSVYRPGCTGSVCMSLSCRVCVYASVGLCEWSQRKRPK